MIKRLWTGIASSGFAPELLLAGLALLAMLPSLGLGPVSDDFSWLQLAKQGQFQRIGQYVSQPAPFGYFRPMPLLFFRISWQLFGKALWLYRLAALLLHALTVVLVYRLTRRFSFPGRIPLISAALFALMPCHAEALLWLCSINELLAAFFILGGIYLFFSRESWRGAGISSIFFLTALLSRESAFCFIPLLLLLWLLFPGGKKGRLALALAVPSAVYYLMRFLWSRGLPDSYLPPAPGRLDLNLIRMLSRLAQYLIKMMLPVKSLMEFFAFRPYAWFREIYNYPQMHPAAFWATSLGALMAISFLFYGSIKACGSRIIWPLLFSILALSVYLPFYNTGERFLYLPSAGAAVGLAAWVSVMLGKRRNLGLGLLVLIVMVYGVSFGNRVHRWHQVGDMNQKALARLEQMTEKLPPGSRVYLEEMPGLVYGIPFFSYFTFNDAWRYAYPERIVEFYFDPAPRPGNTAADLYFSLKETDFMTLPREDIPLIKR
jgi:hypothetical protein